MRVAGYTISILSAEAILRRRGLEEGGAVQRFIDSEAIRLCAPYAPFERGVMQMSATLGTQIGSGKIIYNSAYAKQNYYGKVMVSPTTGSPWARRGERKVLTNQDLQFVGAPKRGAFWFERMKIDHGETIRNEVRAHVNQ